MSSETQNRERTQRNQLQLPWFMNLSSRTMINSNYIKLMCRFFLLGLPTLYDTRSIHLQQHNFFCILSVHCIYFHHYVLLSIHSKWYLGCFHVLIICNSNVMNIGVTCIRTYVVLRVFSQLSDSWVIALCWDFFPEEILQLFS